MSRGDGFSEVVFKRWTHKIPDVCELGEGIFMTLRKMSKMKTELLLTEEKKEYK